MNLMARRNRDERMPATGAGLIRYFKEETHGPKVSPRTIAGFCAAVIIFEILLHAGVLT